MLMMVIIIMIIYQSNDDHYSNLDATAAAAHISKMQEDAVADLNADETTY